MSKSRGVEIIRNQVEHSYPNRRFMRLRTPFSVIKNALGDIRAISDLNYEVPVETREESLKEECDIRLNSSK